MEQNVSNILKKTEGGLAFYKFVIKEPLITKNDKCFKSVKSTFYHDTKPSVSIFLGTDGKWCFKDYGEMGHKGDVFVFAALYYGLDRKDFGLILSKMNEDLKLGLGLTSNGTSTNIEVQKKVKYTFGNDSYFELFERDNGEFNSEEKMYLKQYKIEEYVTKSFRMIPIDGYSYLDIAGELKSVYRKIGQIMFAYTWNGGAKIYAPSPQRMFRYLGQKAPDYIFGKSNLATMDCRGHVVFITAGEKDVMSLYAHGYDAICLNSETASMPDGLLDLLELLYENVIVLYDSDSTGIKSSISLCKQNNLKRLELPSGLIERKLGKDISDYFKVLNNQELLSANKDIVGLELFDNSIQDVIDGKINFIDVVVEEKDIVSPAVRTATQRLIDAQNMPPIKSLMGPFWHSNELAILFGDTGLGKSILAVNIADMLSKGSNFMSLENQNDPLVTLYFDFELSDKQFQKRYTNDSGELYEFHPKFFIDNINFVELAEQNSELSFDEMLYNKIANSVEKIGAQVLIIDNITFLKSESSQDANVAIQIMSQLNKLKINFGISILVLAHTPKRSGSNGITISDLAGSKHLSNFSDSVFAIGKSAKDKNLRYLKQVKPSRSAECIYDSDNVLICELDKEDKGLFFEFVGLSKEQEHLSSDSKSSEELLNEALELRKTGMAIREIAKALGTSKSTIGRLLAK